MVGRRSSLSRQEATCRRHGARRDLRRGEGSPPRSASIEGGRGRSHPRKPTAQKKHDRGWGRRGMRYSASDKTEIIRLVEQSHFAGSTHAGETRHSQIVVLPLV